MKRRKKTKTKTVAAPAATKESPFAKFRGIGTGLPSGRKAINRWLREMRGH